MTDRRNSLVTMSINKVNCVLALNYRFPQTEIPLFRQHLVTISLQQSLCIRFFLFFLSVCLHRATVSSFPFLSHCSRFAICNCSIPCFVIACSINFRSTRGRTEGNYSYQYPDTYALSHIIPEPRCYAFSQSQTR
jgi:hypothetical protein